MTLIGAQPTFSIGIFDINDSDSQLTNQNANHANILNNLNPLPWNDFTPYITTLNDGTPKNATNIFDKNIFYEYIYK